MPAFRLHTPKHRKNRRICKHYKSYKKTLRADFNKRCGYCNDFYSDHKRYFVIDHFIPQNPNGWTHSIPPNKYNNLIYACAFCNGAKSNKWPTNDETRPNNGTQGFIKPTLKLYAKVFRRSKEGEIVVRKNNQVGLYIHKELNLDLTIHSLNWKIEKILKQEEELEKLCKLKGNIALQQDLDVVKLSRLSVIDEISIFFNAQ